MNWLLVVAGAMVGAPLRYLTDRAVQARHDSVFPWGTFAVNAAGSLGFILGPLTGGFVSERVAAGAGWLDGYRAAFALAGLSEVLCVAATLPFLLRRR